MNGIFTISLDFELHWGGFEKWSLNSPQSIVHSSKLGTQDFGLKTQDSNPYNEYFMNTRKVIPQMLGLFEEYGAHVTWATVGMLFHQTKSELLANAPAQKPTYEEKKLSAYEYINTVGIGENEQEDPFHFAPTLIRQIIATPHQEIGTHTFAHYYCNEAGQQAEQFRDDLRAAQRVAKSYGCKLQSLVFPRNQFNDDYLKVCFEEGITSVRSNPLDWFWHIESTQSESAWKRLNRGLDAYFPIGKKNTYALDALALREGFPVCIPASRLLRPYRPKEFVLNRVKIERIKSEMTRAAQRHEVYHVWWHPHNFGNHPAESLEGLRHILRHYHDLKNKYGMESCTMGEITQIRQVLSPA